VVLLPSQSPKTEVSAAAIAGAQPQARAAQTMTTGRRERRIAFTVARLIDRCAGSSGLSQWTQLQAVTHTRPKKAANLLTGGREGDQAMTNTLLCPASHP
jgi:hypothetical protein